MEKRIGFVILLCLVGIAAAFFLKQRSFNPAVLVAHSLASAQSPTAIPTDSIWLPTELKVFSAPENFTPDNLYDKINGKAELYVAAGLVGMHCQRFALKDAPDEWLEWFVYKMGSSPQAFSVFSTQRRADGQPLELTENGYRTQNALFFISGSNYVEAVASSDNKALMTAMLEMTRHFIGSSSAPGERMPEMELFPASGLIEGSLTLQTSDAFGFDQFKNVYSATYKIDEQEVMAFVTSCSDNNSAAALRDSYRAFLIENGGKETASVADTAVGALIEIIGTHEAVFSQGRFVAGVHSAPSAQTANALAKSIQLRLTEQIK